MIVIAYYNEIEPFATDWLANLIENCQVSPGTIDQRSIKDVEPDDVAVYERCHFFAGIGGWELALQLAGWPADRPVWTGSCPCQPYSSAGKGKGDSDDRNLWPDFFRLIQHGKPVTIFGEQVAAAVNHGWLDRVQADLEGEGYTFGAVVLGAHSIGSPHIRQRLFWVAHCKSNMQREREYQKGESIKDRRCSTDCCRVSIANSSRLNKNERSVERQRSCTCKGHCELDSSGMVNGIKKRPQGHVWNEPNRNQPRRLKENTVRPTPSTSTESFAYVVCLDGKSRRVPLPESGVHPLAYGVPRKLGSLLPGIPKLANRAARSNRTGRLKGYGNAIVPQVAAEFIQAFLDIEKSTS